jgi:hypothetical protein
VRYSADPASQQSKPLPEILKSAFDSGAWKSQMLNQLTPEQRELADYMSDLD